MKVWRIHIKNDITKGYTRRDLLSFCLKEKLIGVGWGEIKTRINDEAIIRQEASVYAPDEMAGIKALNAIRKMKIEDLFGLVWMVYIICGG